MSKKHDSDSSSEDKSDTRGKKEKDGATSEDSSSLEQPKHPVDDDGKFHDNDESEDSSLYDDKSDKSDSKGSPTEEAEKEDSDEKKRQRREKKARRTLGRIGDYCFCQWQERRTAGKKGH